MLTYFQSPYKYLIILNAIFIIYYIIIIIDRIPLFGVNVYLLTMITTYNSTLYS